MKKISILFLACFLFVNTMTANAQLISPDDVPTPIETLSYTDWMTDYDPALAWAFENDILTGDGTTGDLRETDCVKRAEILKMLYNVLQIDTTNPQAELFSDTFADQWYADYVRKARERSTIEGYPDGTFQPAQCVNRVEAIKMALLEFPNITPANTPFTGITDVPESEWYYPYASYALGNDLVGLKHLFYSTNYYPGESMTREEFAEMLYRLKTLQDNSLTSYDAAYGPENLIGMQLVDYNLEPEGFLESGTSLLIILDTHNQSQVSIVDGFISSTPAGSVDEFVELLFESISNDIQPAFDGGLKVMFAVGEPNSLNPLESLLFTVNDSTKLESAFTNLSSQEGFSKSTLFGFKTFDNLNDGTYYAYTDEVMATWPTYGDRYLALQKIKNEESNLLDNSEYTTFLSSVPSPSVGTVYFNAPTSGSGILALVPNSSGIKLYYRINELEGYGSGASNPPYMYKKLPGNDLLMYGESDGMIDNLGAQGTDLILELQQEGMLVTAGDWLNQGYAFVMQDTGTLIPGISLYFDAAGYVAQAQEDLAILDSFIDVVLAQMDAEDPEFAAVTVKDTVIVDGATLNRVSIDLTAVPQEELSEFEMFEGLLTEPIEFYYGLTSDNYVVLSLYSGFDTVYGNVGTVSSNADIRAGLANLTGYPNGLSYMSLENMLTYVDMLIVEIEKTDPMPAEMKEGYTQVMDYLNPIKYIISAEKEFIDGLPGGLMFVKIN
jgi:hypothetical protein